MNDTAAPAAPPLPPDADLLCGRCGHNLRGVPSDRCPECGRRFDRARIVLPNVPWEQRRQIGYVRAYCRTVRLITFRPAKLAAAQDAVSLGAALSFRRWTLALLFVTFLTPLVLWRIAPAALAVRPASAYAAAAPLIPLAMLPDPPEILRNRWFFGTSIVSLLLWVVAITGVQSYFFHPARLTPEAQKRGVALSYYALAPLAWIPVLAASIGLLLWVLLKLPTANWIFYTISAVYGTAALLLLLVPVEWLWTTARFLAAATGSRRRAAAAIVLLPLIWAALAGGIFLGLQLVVNYVALLWAGRW